MNVEGCYCKHWCCMQCIIPSFLSCRQRIVACQLEKSSKPIIGLEGGCARPASVAIFGCFQLDGKLVNKENIPTGSGHIPNLGIRAVQMLLVDFRTPSWFLKRAWLLDFLGSSSCFKQLRNFKMSQQNDLEILVKVNCHDIFPDQLSNTFFMWDILISQKSCFEGGECRSSTMLGWVVLPA